MDFCICTAEGKERDLESYAKVEGTGNWQLGWQPSGNLEELNHQQAPVLAIGSLFGSLRQSSGLTTGDSETLGHDALDSNGSFAVVIPRDKEVIVVTDAGGSIPVYCGSGPDGLVIGTLVHHVARLSGLRKLDKVSAVDYLINETVCHPYTWYKDVRVLPPGSICTFSREGMDVHTYWEPTEPDDISESCDVRSWGKRLHKEVRRAVECGIKGKNQGRVLFSAGADSRAVASLVPDDFDCIPTTVLDSQNREYRLANWAAWGLGRSLEWIKRPPEFYRSAISERIDTVGPGLDFRHTHFYDPISETLRDADVLLGGFLSDTLFKTYFMANVESNRRLRPDRLLSPLPDEIKAIQPEINPKWFRKEIVEEVRSRRKKHHQTIKKMRPLTAGNWHVLWPLKEHPYYPQYLSCLRIGPRVVEPFSYSRVYRLAAQMPDLCRINQRAFRVAFAKSMGVAGWLPTSNDKLPRLGEWANRIFRAGYWRYKRWKCRLIKSRGAQGSWSPDQRGWFPVRPKQHYGLEKRKKIRENISNILSKEREVDEFFGDKKISDNVRVRSMSLSFGRT